MGKGIFWLVLVAIVFFPTYSKIQRLKQKDRVLLQKVEALKVENERLKQENEMLRSDPIYIEEVARDKLKVARENEIIFRIVDETEE